MQTTELVSFIQDKIDDMKGRDIVAIDVRGKSSVTEFMIVCSGTSNRHTKSIADYVAAEVKKSGHRNIGYRRPELRRVGIIRSGRCSSARNAGREPQFLSVGKALERLSRYEVNTDCCWQ